MKRRIGEMPYFLSILLVIVACLNFSLPMLLHNQRNQTEFLRRVEQVFEIETINVSELAATMNEIFEDTENHLLVEEEQENLSISLNGREVQRLDSSSSPAELIEEVMLLREEVVQLLMIQPILLLLQGSILAVFVFFVLVVATRFMYRHTLKVRDCVIYLSVPFLLGSFIAMVVYANLQQSPILALFVGWGAASIFFQFVCYRSLKETMNADFLGEERSDYGIY